MKRKAVIKGVLTRSVLIGCAMLAALAPSAYSQIENTLKFIPDKVDFGMIREEDGKVSREVKAVNISPDSTFIISARTSCGCSAADYTESVLAPGDTALVRLTYDPFNRPGRFLKTAKFFTGSERRSNSIKMSGTVIPSRSNLDRAYPEKEGQLRLSTLILNTGEMSRSEARPMFVGIYNDSDKPFPISAETDSAPLEAAIVPDTIEPYGVASLSLMLKGRAMEEKEQEFLYKAYLINQESGDTVACIPVGGTVKPNQSTIHQ